MAGGDPLTIFYDLDHLYTGTVCGSLNLIASVYQSLNGSLASQSRIHHEKGLLQFEMLTIHFTWSFAPTLDVVLFSSSLPPHSVSALASALGSPRWSAHPLLRIRSSFPS